MKAYLLLEDGTVFEGSAFGSTEAKIGEVVFNTSMTGYEEILNDYSYTGQTVVMAYPMIGNYGLCTDSMESIKPTISGLVVREFCKGPNNWKNQMSVEDYLKEHRIMGIEGIDTRMLVKHLRDHGTMKGIITKSLDNETELIDQLKENTALEKNITGELSTGKPYTLEGKGPKIALFDFGDKLSTIKVLQSYDCQVTVLPYDTPAEAVLKMDLDGVVLSNGPGDPQTLRVAVENIKKLMNHKPIFGICMGHQLLALASGAKTYKLKHGHRGANQPVKDLITNKVYITSQNHGYCVDEATIDYHNFIVTHKNLNDGTVEGMRHKYLPILSIQYQLQTTAGSQESKYLFEEFLNPLYLKKAAV